MKKIFTLISIFTASATCLWAQATPNAGFETWTTTGFPSYDAPTGWDTPNSQTNLTGQFVAIKTTDKHSGATAIKLVTKNIQVIGFGGTAPGIATTGTLPTSATGSITGGIPYTLRPDSIVGFYKYTSVSGDNGFMEFRLSGPGGYNDSIAVIHFVTPTSTVSTYTRFSAPLTYYSTATPVNSMWVICSSKDDVTPQLGSTLFIDDLDLVWGPTTTVAEQVKVDLTVGPNPATDHLLIRKAFNSKAVFTLYDITGRKVVEEKIVNTTNSIDVNSLPAGLYIYEVKDENNDAEKTGKIIIKK